MEIRDLSRSNQHDIATLNDHTIASIKTDLDEMKETLEQGKKTSEMNVRLFGIINQLEGKVNKLR